MPLANMTSNTSSSAFSSNPVPALIARRTTVLAPPSLSTVNHLDGVTTTSSSSSSSTSTMPRPSTTAPLPARRHRPDLAQAVSQPTAAVPISTHENISTSKSWSSHHMLKPSHSSYHRRAFGDSGSGTGEVFAVHPTFRSDAEWRGDVLVRVEGVEFWVHKDVLLFSSPFFQSVLAGGWRESRLSRLIAEEGGVAEKPTCQASEQEEGANDNAGLSSGAPPSPTGRTLPQEEPPSQAVLVSDVAEDSPTELQANEPSSNDLNPDYLGGEARRRSLLRASYHTALWSQDDDPRASPTLSHCPTAFEDTAEEPLLANEAATDSAEERGEESEDENAQNSDDGKLLATADAEEEKVEGLSAASSDKQGTSRIKQGRSKKIATRLTLRKLESAQRAKQIPTRSTSRTIDLGDINTATGPHERMESLATPPLSRRPSEDLLDRATSSQPEIGVCDAAESKVQPPPPTTTTTNTVPPRYKGTISVIDLSEESASTFHDFLFHIYPHLDLSVTWYNCGPLLRFSDKFQVPFLRRSCITFLRAALAGRPIEAMRLAELHGIDDLYKEASRHVLDNFSAWQPDELEALSNETLLKLERKRTWFLERLLKLGLANPARDYECHAACPDPQACARLLHEKWQTAYKAAFRFHPPQPSVIFRYLRELDSIGHASPPSGGGGSGLAMSAATAAVSGGGGGIGGGGVGGGTALQLSNCQTTARVWVQGLFDRMFELGTLHTGRLFLAVKLDAVAPRNLVNKDC